MSYQNFTILMFLGFFLINLIICTLSRRYLSYQWILLFMLGNLILLVVLCFCFWEFFIFEAGSEVLNFKLNSNNWANINYEIILKINILSYLFIFLVSIIGLATNFYILNYFKFEERTEEFILLINWFIFSMIFLVIGNNFFTIILGWELIGLTSFLLINFWRFKISTLGCSFKAFTFNKISDIFLMIGFCLLWNKFKTSNVDTLLTLINLNLQNSNDILLKSGVCILVSSSIKSAQFLGHLWLPDSMEAPVPASSLIHSATLVSAGIYLLLKFQIIFITANLIWVVFFLGSFTACYGGLTAAAQSDMKKLLAYSTISHCGFIVASISLNNFLITITYLYLHGLFKALTFFCAGSLIKVNGTQDTRLMGMNKNQLLNTVMLVIASTNLGGLPFTFGYLYKFIFLNYLIFNPLNFVGYGLNIVGMLCSIVYVYKLIYYSCFDFRKGSFFSLILLLQNNKSDAQSELLNFSYFKVIAFYIIFFFSFIFFFLVKFYFLKNYIVWNYSGFSEVNNYLFLTKVIFSQSYLLSLFYILFTAVSATLILLNWRENEFFFEKFKLISTLVNFSVFYAICAKFVVLGNKTIIMFFVII